jgi:DNA-binding Lrp family transcriptional regulator
MQVVAQIFDSLSDNVSLELFTAIANESINSVVLRNSMKITRKQYYSRLSKMIKAGIIKRTGGKLVLTAFGKIMYEVQKTVENASKNQWKLRAIDSVEFSDELPKEERRKLLESLIDNRQLREILSAGAGLEKPS